MVPGDVDARTVVEQYAGVATIGGYSVVHDRAGSCEWALLVLNTPDGSRCYGRVDDVDVLNALEADEFVGRAVSVHARPHGVHQVSM